MARESTSYGGTEESVSFTKNFAFDTCTYYLQHHPYIFLFLVIEILIVGLRMQDSLHVAHLVS